MKFSYIGIIAILLVTIVTVFAGCTDSAQPTPSVITPQVTSTEVKMAGITLGTTSSQSITTVPINAKEKPVKIFSGDYNWVEYRNNFTQTLPPSSRQVWESDVKVERSHENYMGSPAILYKITTIGDYSGGVDKIIKKGWIGVDNYYYDTSTDRFLGGTETNTIMGELQPIEDIPSYQHKREERPWREIGIMPLGEMNIALAYQGTESVTVPEGNYPETRKYTGSFRDGTPITFWVAPNIPVPIQYQFPNKYKGGVDPFESFELIAWG